jgi:succinate dehydrogenase/fumarate reductase flavoprotein subunit
LIVAGAGMAGLVAAARVLELGGDATVYEKGDRPGGSMLLSSGVVWRHREWDAFREECGGGDAALQRLVWERLDDALAWLRTRGAPVLEEDTANPRTTGKRFDTRGLTNALAGGLGDRLVLGRPAPLDAAVDAVLLATGGFGGSHELVHRYVRPAAPLRLRANPWSAGDGLRHALAAGAALTAGMDEFYGRNMPGTAWTEADFVPAAQLFAAHARIVDEQGVEFFRAEDVSWSETNVVQATAHRPGASAYYLLTEEAMREPAVAGRAGPLLAPDALPFRPPAGTAAAVRVVASITHTIGGVRVDERARVLGDDGAPVPGLLAAGVDVGGIATGGYASGLAQALVLGLTAAETAAAFSPSRPSRRRCASRSGRATHRPW